MKSPSDCGSGHQPRSLGISVTFYVLLVVRLVFRHQDKAANLICVVRCGAKGRRSCAVRGTGALIMRIV